MPLYVWRKNWINISIIMAQAPHMLYFQRVKSPELAGITHIDGSARVQTVNNLQNPEIYALLSEFKKLTGYGVLCNTSLNYPGCGFINRSSDLIEYASSRKLNGFIIGKKIYLNTWASWFTYKRES